MRCSFASRYVFLFLSNAMYAIPCGNLEPQDGRTISCENLEPQGELLTLKKNQLSVPFGYCILQFTRALVSVVVV
ncbi:hypothetical protein M5K25_013923 [Dendrobium thyrsiflorum]|uniref:Secreted protein n=1 Tax=Dendrobium thyrsiflorum TaxID=117978 RepID=A0ABD0UU34_DENTH